MKEEEKKRMKEKFSKAGAKASTMTEAEKIIQFVDDFVSEKTVGMDFDEQISFLNSNEYDVELLTRWADEQVKEYKSLLSVARCPDCDGSGAIPHQFMDGEWDFQQCQWCYEKNELLNKKP